MGLALTMLLIVAEPSALKTKGGKSFIPEGDPHFFSFEINDVASSSQRFVEE